MNRREHRPFHQVETNWRNFLIGIEFKYSTWKVKKSVWQFSQVLENLIKPTPFAELDSVMLSAGNTRLALRLFYGRRPSADML